MAVQPLQLTPLLRTLDLPGSIHFYTRVLDFDCMVHDAGTGWALLKWQNIDLMLATANAHMPFEKPSFTGSLYFRIKSVDEYFAKLAGTVKVLYEPETFSWGMREFAIHDNNDYILQFGEEMAAD